MLLWRIERSEHVNEALHGKGAERFGGRWNPEGIPVVYLATTLSLAAYERFVYAPIHSKHMQLFAIGVEIPDHDFKAATRPTPLPTDWRSPEPPTSTAGWSRAWATAQTTLAAAVPSTLLPLDLFIHGLEFNVLLNPTHPGMNAVRIVDQQPFAFDLRAWKEM